VSDIALVARDAAPSRCFHGLFESLISRGHSVDLMVGDGRPVEVSIDTVCLSQLILLGMSSTAKLAEPELLAGQIACDAKIPYGFYGDVPRCWARARKGAWFEELAKGASFYLAADEDDVEAAREVFPESTRLVAVGNPLREQMAFPKYSRQEARELMGIDAPDRMVLVPGGKSVVGNILLWHFAVTLMERVNNFFDEGKVHLVLAIHPGDPALHSACGFLPAIYEELINYSLVPTGFLIPDYPPLNTMEAVSGADLVVEFSGSIGIAAAYQRIPVLAPKIDILARNLKAESGYDEPELLQKKAALGVGEDIGPTIARVVALLDSNILADQQTKAYPIPQKKGEALENIVRVLEETLAG
jgi:hypothetical protein